MLIVLLFIVNKSICYESIACGREECSAMFHFFPETFETIVMIKWTQSTGNVHNINCWTVLEELYNRYIFQQVLTYISANLIVILNLCTLIEILLKVFIRYIRLEIGREYFELTKNNYLLHEPRLVLLW